LCVIQLVRCDVTALPDITRWTDAEILFLDICCIIKTFLLTER